MAKSFEPDIKKFTTYMVVALVFLSVIAVLIIRKKREKELANPPEKILIQ